MFSVLDETPALHWAASLEARSEHPFAQAILRAANERGLHHLTIKGSLPPPAAESLSRILTPEDAEQKSRDLLLGSAAFLAAAGITIPRWPTPRRRARRKEGVLTWQPTATRRVLRAG